MRSRQHCGRVSKGSRFHLQNFVNEYPEYLDCLILSASPSLRIYARTHPKWVSPLASDDYCEYQDRRFLEAIGLPQLAEGLSDFWPPGGPVWDALATLEGSNGSQGVLLLEAKSHSSELCGPAYACDAGGRSLERIKESLATVKRVWGVAPGADWLSDCYQHASRLAHLYLFDLAGVPTWMVFLYFVGDSGLKSPSTVAGWTTAIEQVKTKLGLEPFHPLGQRVVSVFSPVSIATP